MMKQYHKHLSEVLCGILNNITVDNGSVTFISSKQVL